jgi:hypothetical protein
MNCIEQRNELDRVWSTDPQFDACSRSNDGEHFVWKALPLNGRGCDSAASYIQMKMICVSFIGPGSEDRAKDAAGGLVRPEHKVGSLVKGRHESWQGRARQANRAMVFGRLPLPVLSHSNVLSRTEHEPTNVENDWNEAQSWREAQSCCTNGLA